MYKPLLTIFFLSVFCQCTINDYKKNTGTYYIHVDAEASRAKGVAPLSVHFTAEFDNSASGARDFHNLDYTWDFGDDDTAAWGTNGKSKNAAKGPVAAHVFETPGSFTANLTVTDGTTVVDTRSFYIEVDDPDEIYSGTDTICVSDATSNDFAGCPSGAQQVATDTLGDVLENIQAGTRILLRRNSSWTTGGLSVPGNAGPVTIGAYGAGTGQDGLGIYDNAPQITVTDGEFLPLDQKQDWRITDLHLVNSDMSAGSFGGAINMQRILFQRLRVEGFGCAIGWSHWNSSALMTMDQMVICDCDLKNSDSNVVYIGSERIALMGNIIANSMTTHVARVWQAYLGVISNNIISGSSLNNDNGRHALKLHGPGYSTFDGSDEYGTPVDGTGLLANRTEFAVVSDNVFGSSGPWPVCIGPQDIYTNSLLSDIIFEKNRLITGFGAKSSVNVSVALHISARYTTARNNIFDGTGSGNDYTAIDIWSDGKQPRPRGVEVYNNTIYRSDNTSGNERCGITVRATAANTIIKNNLISFPGSTVLTSAIINYSSSLTEESNLLADTPGFTDPGNAYADDPYVNNFNLDPGSSAIDAGAVVPVYDDMEGTTRPVGSFDIGAYEN